MCEGKKKETKEKQNKTKQKQKQYQSQQCLTQDQAAVKETKKIQEVKGGGEMGRWPIQLHVEQYFVGKENFFLWDKSRKS